jgi:hypothetical protein
LGDCLLDKKWIGLDFGRFFTNSSGLACFEKNFILPESTILIKHICATLSQSRPFTEFVMNGSKKLSFGTYFRQILMLLKSAKIPTVLGHVALKP